MQLSAFTCGLFGADTIKPNQWNPVIYYVIIALNTLFTEKHDLPRYLVSVSKMATKINNDHEYLLKSILKDVFK